MRVMVNGEVKELNCMVNGCDCANDLIGNAGFDGFKYDNDEEIYVTDQETYDWWKEYLENNEADEEKKSEYIEKYGWDAWDEAFNDNWNANEMEQEHAAYQAVFEALDNM